MLRRSRGRTHEVLTGLSRAHAGRRAQYRCTPARASPSAILRRTSLPPTLPPQRAARQGRRLRHPGATAHCSSRASRATITASWVCLWPRFIPFCAIFMRYKPHLPAEIPHFSAHIMKGRFVLRRRHKVGSPLLIGAAVVFCCAFSPRCTAASAASSPITRAAGTVVRPFQRFGTGVGHFFSKGLDYFTEFDALKASRMSTSSSRSATMHSLCATHRSRSRKTTSCALSLGSRRTPAPPPRSAEVIARSPGDWADI